MHFIERTRRRNLGVPVLALLAGAGACGPAAAPAGDPLPSWNDGAAKRAIVAFVRAATDSTSPGYVPPQRRVAAFDNDGTLWVEKPGPVQLAFTLDRVRALAPSHPEWRTRQPFKAVLDNDAAALGRLGAADLVQLVEATHAGMTQAAFDSVAGAWGLTWRHPRFGPLDSLVYPPMRELLDYLRANGFTTFIVTGGGVDFVRSIAPRLYGIPPWQVVASRGEYAYDTLAQAIMRLPGIELNDDRANKPVGIQQGIGLRPVFVAGNSDGDRQMMEYSSGRMPSLQILVHHDDGDREYAYDRGAEITLAEAAARHFVVVSMKNDWKLPVHGR
jgi:phosphoglycolate phosphatase-like HAD superfamily hydrolase